jgi:integrase/recombinase XerC
MRLTIDKAFETFDRLVRRRSAHTRRAYRSDIADFAKWAKAESAGHALFDLLAGDRIAARRRAEAYRAHLAGRRKLAHATVTRRIAALQSFVSAARLDGLVDWKLQVEAASNLSRAARKASGHRNMEGPTPEELKRVRETLRKDRTLAGLRDAAIIALLENPMLRASEVVGLDVRDVDLPKKTVTIVGKARTEPETLPMPQATAADVAAWIDARKKLGPGPLFVRILRFKRVRQGPRWRLIPCQTLTPGRLSTVAVYEITLRRGIEAGLQKKLRPHGLRHTGITMLVNHCAKERIPLTEAMAVSRHRKLDTLLRYLDRQGEQKRALVEAISPATR